MIEISGKIHRSFLFPADLPTAFDFYSDVNRIIHYLPHISLVHKYSDGQYRMLYRTTELGIYRVSIYCDFMADPQAEEQTLFIGPSNNRRVPVQPEAGLYSLVGQGYYSSVSRFYPDESRTKIEYQLELKSELPVPLGLRLMPTNVVESIANNITRWRMKEIVEGFIQRSTTAYLLLSNNKDG